MRRVPAFRLALGLLVMVLVLASFAVYVLGCASSSPRGPATVSSGPVTIALDHSVYGPDDDIQVTVSNHSHTAVTTSWHITENCLPFYVSPENGTAVGNTGTYCYASEAAPGYRNYQLGFGSSLMFAIDREARDEYHIVLSPGTYRIAMPWATVMAYNIATSIGQAISQPFRICTCATCS
ncbi:MAG TPA: hypothetical protein VGS80_16360 [Ktedonobacterales bacterium]|nr:hypothetical protein [Ktedonobacterales bacterium]